MGEGSKEGRRDSTTEMKKEAREVRKKRMVGERGELGY